MLDCLSCGHPEDEHDPDLEICAVEGCACNGFEALEHEEEDELDFYDIEDFDD